MKKPAKILFYVQHLLGIGHLKRTATLARAMERAGFAITLVSGGKTVPGLDIGGAEFVQLAPMRTADDRFKIMLDDCDRPIDDAFRDARRDALLDVFERLRPDVILTELFPFGRRQLRFELIPLLDAAKARRDRPLIVSSVRDILVEPGKPERVDEMLDLVERYYDAVLVHGDPGLIPFDETFPPAARIADRLRYTGYVVDPPPEGARASGLGSGEVIVSAGGGAISEPLFAAAIAARPATRLSDAPWRLLAGYGLPDDAFQRIAAAAGDGIVVERARPDFTTLLANCTLSISQGGYNTVMDLLAARCRAVISPYAGGLESEQTLRAALLSERGALQVVRETDLSAETLARAVEAALDGPRPDAVGLDTGGGPATARILAELVAQHEKVAP